MFKASAVAKLLSTPLETIVIELTFWKIEA